MDGMIIPQRRYPGLNLLEEPQSPRERVEKGIFGFWVFLMSDAVVFALLFAIYGTMIGATAGAPGPAQEFKIGSAFIETLVLLTSSFTFGMASLALKHDRKRRGLVLWLLVTLVLGAVFVRLEVHDFTTMIGDGASADQSGFLSAFFVLVGMHGLHVSVGVLWGLAMLLQLATFGLDDRVKVNLMRLALFWHFLDVIWVTIFSVVYLQGVMR
jgi:cytochrome o ubiquinol oxidase subunit III